MLIVASKDQDGDAPASYHKMGKVFAQRTAEKFAAHLLPHIKPHMRILDVGCGHGSITVGLARWVPEGEVIGIDINDDWLAQTNNLATQQELKNMKCQKGNVLDLDEFADDSFDIVHAHQCLLHVPGQLKAMKEMRRVCKTRGILATRDNCRRIIVPTNRTLQWQLDIFGEVNHITANEAGFEWEKIEMSSWAWEYPGKQGRDDWASVAKNSFRAAAVKAGLATEEQMDEQKAEWEKWQEDPTARFIGLDGALICWK